MLTSLRDLLLNRVVATFPVEKSNSQEFGLAHLFSWVGKVMHSGEYVHTGSPVFGISGRLAISRWSRHLRRHFGTFT